MPQEIKKKKRKLPAAEHPQPGVTPSRIMHTSLLNESFRESIIQMAKDGHTDQQIADAIGINFKTFLVWRSKYPNFLEALKDAKGLADDLVEATLFQKALGYQHKAVKIFFDSKSLQTVEHKYTEIYPPDTTAAIFWLKNRRPKEWREKIEIDHNNVNKMSDEELAQVLKDFLKSEEK